MIKFHLINYRNHSTDKNFNQIVVGTFERVEKYAEGEAIRYNTKFYIEHSRVEWDMLLEDALTNSPHKLINLCN